MQEELHRTEDLNPSVAADIAESATATSEVPLGGTEDMIEFSTLIAQCQQELAEAKNANLRAHADFDNYRKRMRAERDQEYIRGRDRVIMELLPIIDDFERALSAAPEEKTANSLRKGVELIHRQMLNMLGRYGITAMHVDSQRFDPKYHDAVARVISPDQPEHTIVGEIQRGYLKEAEVFRPAKVAVSVKPDEPIAE